MEKEIAAMEEFGVWEECVENDVPKACKLLGSKWVLKIKTTDCGLLESFKARLVILGNQARPYEHYDPRNVYSPVMTYDSFRILLAVGCALDWETRYFFAAVTKYFFRPLHGPFFCGRYTPGS